MKLDGASRYLKCEDQLKEGFGITSIFLRTISKGSEKHNRHPHVSGSQGSRKVTPELVKEYVSCDLGQSVDPGQKTR